MSDVTLHKRRKQLSEGFRCVDLFAGAGGLAVGFRQAGWCIASGTDMDAGASETFRLNFPEASFFEGPISGVSVRDMLSEASVGVGELDCLIGGPPCQSFSHNNHKRNAVDDRARLFEHYLSIVKDMRPKTIVMENVPGILSIDGGSVVEEITSGLKDLGYSEPCVRILSAEQFGTPQVRRRAFIVASRIGPSTELLPTATHWSPRFKHVGYPKNRPDGATKRPVTVWQAIGDLPPLDGGSGLQEWPRDWKCATSTFQRKAQKGAPVIFNHIGHVLTEVNLARVVHIPQGGNWRDVPRELLPAGMRRAKLTDHTKRYGRLHKDGFASTILTKCDPHWGAYIHPTEDRTITVREAARLQGFPDSFRFAGNKIGPQYVQVGNAVPVPLAFAIGQAVHRHICIHDHLISEAA